MTRSRATHTAAAAALAALATLGCERLAELGLAGKPLRSAPYRERVAGFAEANARLAPPCAVLLGDSLTEAFPAALAPDGAWVNRGISGDRVADVGLRLRVSALDPPCGTVALLAGTNDLLAEGAPPERVALAVASLADRLRSAGKRVLLTTIPPVSPHDAPANDAIRAANAALRAEAAKRSGVVLLDLAAALEASGRAFHEPDGVHLGPAAYEIWAGELRRIPPPG